MSVDTATPLAAAVSAPPQARTETLAPGEDQWTNAARRIKRLPPAEFPELPAAFIKELEQLGCTMPQSDFSRERGNVIHGSFGATGQQDWAVLCSRNGTSVILVHWGGPVQCPRELEPAEDKHFLQTMVGDSIFFSRSIHPTQSYHVYPDQDSARVERDVQLEHDAIEDAFDGKGSTVWFCRNGKWISFSGAD